MGKDKAWLELGGAPLIVRVLTRVQQIADDILISANDGARFEKLNLCVVADVMPGAGPLAGICAGLEAAEHDTSIVVACDMPFLNVTLLEFMRAFAPDYDVVIPQTEMALAAKAAEPKQNARAKDLALHPLHAVYTKNCLAPIRAALRRGERRLISFHQDVRVRVISPQELERFDPQGYALWNVNTPDKLQYAQAAIQDGDVQ